jgi:energy-coupling factor transporter transmembrane protein EcfT
MRWKKITKRKVILSIIFFSILFVFMPVIKCMEDYPTNEKICKLYHKCEVDVYNSLFFVLTNPDISTDCPDGELTSIRFLSLFFLEIILSIFLSILIDMYYEKYRNI